MSGKKGMVHYSGEMKEQVRKEIVAGKSQREVSRKYGMPGTHFKGGSHLMDGIIVILRQSFQLSSISLI